MTTTDQRKRDTLTALDSVADALEHYGVQVISTDQNTVTFTGLKVNGRTPTYSLTLEDEAGEPGPSVEQRVTTALRRP